MPEKDEFVCERRGTVAVKGKGEMETWYLIGPRRGDDGHVADDVAKAARAAATVGAAKSG